jgi:hypothetical protein
VKKEWRHNQSDSGQHFDQDVDRGACSILEGIANCIPGNCRLVRLGTLATKGTLFDILFGIVPCTTGRVEE